MAVTERFKRTNDKALKGLIWLLYSQSAAAVVDVWTSLSVSFKIDF